jgi:hypothetical protein
MTALQLLPLLASPDVRHRLVFLQVLRSCCGAAAHDMCAAA